jgi:4-hydroxy-tetrahydrodipicolinate synthase
LSENEVREHYERVAAAIRIPICVYNNPWTTGVDMKPEFLARLAKMDNISCIKESTGDLTRITSIRLLTNDQIAIIAGWESSSLQAFSAGATGWAPVCTNFFPRLAMDFFHAAVDKADIMKARILWTSFFRYASLSAANLIFAPRIPAWTFWVVQSDRPGGLCEC